ncbi:MAG: hypothetical protein Q9227_008300 [Pyrenula ochraceoflavens]
MQDELSSMIAQRLHLENPTVQAPPTPQEPPSPAPISYISQHYHHSSHKAPTIASRDDLTEAREILIQHNIDAGFLFPSQLNLFAQGDLDQRRRLIELWQIAPPRYGTQMAVAHDPGNWQQTSLAREEEAAQQRYLTMMVDEGAAVRVNNGPIDEMMKGQNSPLDSRGQAEPYMVSGYTEMRPDAPKKEISFGQDGTRGSWSSSFEYNRAVDPAYQNGGSWWSSGEGNGTQPMEHQYGAFEAMREQAAMAREREDQDML